MKPEDRQLSLIVTRSGELVRRMDQRLDLVNRLLSETTAKPSVSDLDTAKRITAEIARRFVADTEVADLSEYQAIDEDAAEILAGSNCQRLDLNGLTNLSNGAARALSQFRGEHLFLRGLTNISDKAGQYLSRFNGDINNTPSADWVANFHDVL